MKLIICIFHSNKYDSEVKNWKKSKIRNFGIENLKIDKTETSTNRKTKKKEKSRKRNFKSQKQNENQETLNLKN